MAKENNPIKVIEINQADHKRPDRETVVHHKIFDNGASIGRRKSLAKEVRQLHRYFSESFDKWPTVAAVSA